MAQHNVSNFVEKRLVRQLGDWINGYLSLLSVSLTIAIRLSESNALNV
jgi:hypothetical protein